MAQAFFCLAALMALVTSRWWENAADFSQSANAGSGRRLAYLGAATVSVVYLQLIAGAVMRHFGAAVTATWGKLPRRRDPRGGLRR